MLEIGFSRNYFTKGKSVDSVHNGPAVDGGTELIKARPPAALVSKGAGQGVEEEWDAGNSFRAAPKGGRRRGGRVSRRRGGGRGGGARWGCAPARERRRGELGEGQDAPGVLR
jgi:hypothetical protein